MANNFFLKIDGIEGGSSVQGHEGEIDIESVSYGASHPGSLQTQTGASTGFAIGQDISVIKQIDKATNAIFQKACSGEHIKEAILSFAYTSGEQIIVYKKVTLAPVMISSHQFSGSSNSSLMESVSINYQTVKIEITPQGDEGTPEGAKTAGWDFRANKKI